MPSEVEASLVRRSYGFDRTRWTLGARQANQRCLDSVRLRLTPLDMTPVPILLIQKELCVTNNEDPHPGESTGDVAESRMVLDEASRKRQLRCTHSTGCRTSAYARPDGASRVSVRLRSSRSCPSCAFHLCGSLWSACSGATAFVPPTARNAENRSKPSAPKALRPSRPREHENKSTFSQIGRNTFGELWLLRE